MKIRFCLLNQLLLLLMAFFYMGTAHSAEEESTSRGNLLRRLLVYPVIKDRIEECRQALRERTYNERTERMHEISDQAETAQLSSPPTFYQSAKIHRTDLPDLGALPEQLSDEQKAEFAKEIERAWEIYREIETDIEAGKISDPDAFLSYFVLRNDRDFSAQVRKKSLLNQAVRRFMVHGGHSVEEREEEVALIAGEIKGLFNSAHRLSLNNALSAKEANTIKKQIADRMVKLGDIISSSVQESYKAARQAAIREDIKGMIVSFIVLFLFTYWLSHLIIPASIIVPIATLIPFIIPLITITSILINWGFDTKVEQWPPEPHSVVRHFTPAKYQDPWSSIYLDLPQLLYERACTELARNPEFAGAEASLELLGEQFRKDLAEIAVRQAPARYADVIRPAITGRPRLLKKEGVESPEKALMSIYLRGFVGTVQDAAKAIKDRGTWPKEPALERQKKQPEAQATPEQSEELLDPRKDKRDAQRIPRKELP